MQQIGRELGNYRLIRLIGTGGFGGAYLGEHIHSGTQAVIKVLEVRTKEDAERFLAEARIIARLVHPNIIRVALPHEKSAFASVSNSRPRKGLLFC